jgi:BirA family biotin operon repressor/biotin-[acetyl-CoA-carboxylase] ligase
MDFTIRKYATLDSTNAEALRLIKDGKGFEGLVLLTEEQTEGKGAGQNRWESELGKNLTFSVIFRPRFVPPARQFVLTEMVSLTLFDVLKKRLKNHHLAIKWPNDLLCDEKKIAGILIQNNIKGSLLDFSVTGVGLNVNQETFQSDAPNPGSLIRFTHKEENKDVLLAEILSRLGYYYEKLKSDIHALRKDYLQRLYRFQVQADYADATGRFSATITGVDAYGRLLMTDNAGNRRQYGFKEVRFL